MRVWRASDGECQQTIVVPAVSGAFPFPAFSSQLETDAFAVWCVSVLANGDIAAGASDGLVRVYTRNEERVASQEELAVRSTNLEILLASAYYGPMLMVFVVLLPSAELRGAGCEDIAELVSSARRSQGCLPGAYP